MGQHPIEELMKTAMESIKEMVDVNTIVGDAVQTIDGTVIIPVSKVCFGFAAGGGEYSRGQKNENANTKYPFAGGSGAGVSINPVAFLVVGRNNTVRLLSASPSAALDGVLGNIPGILEQLKNALGSDEKVKKKCKKEDEHEKSDRDAEKERTKSQDTNEKDESEVK